MPDHEPKKKVDEEWKKRVEEGKKEAEQQEGTSRKEPSDRPMPEATFANFIASLHLQVLVMLGLVPNPATQKTEKDLQQAKYMIDTLQVIQEKTKGNLDDTEKRLLDNILYEVRMRFVDGSSQPPAGDTGGTQPST